MEIRRSTHKDFPGRAILWAKFMTQITWTDEQLNRLEEYLKYTEAEDILKGINWSKAMKSRVRIRGNKVSLYSHAIEEGTMTLEEAKEQCSRTTFYRLKKKLRIT